MTKKLSYLFVLILCIVTFTGCGVLTTGRGGKVKYPSQVATEWRNEFNAAEKAFEAKSYAQAERSYKTYIQKYPYNELTDKSEFRLGQIAMLSQNYPKAIQIFQALIRKTPDFAIKSKSNSKLGICYYRQKNNSDALIAFSAVDARYLEEKERARMSSLAIQGSIEQKEELNKRAYYYAVLKDLYDSLTPEQATSRFGKEEISKQEVETKIHDWVKASTPYDQLDRRFYDYPSKGSRPFIEFKIGKSAFDSKENKKASEHLKSYVSRFPQHEYVSQANQMLGMLGTKVSGEKSETREKEKSDETFSVGVILPLSGKYAQYGQNTLRGMECAASMKPACQGVKNVRLVVKDSGSDPNKAAALVAELTNQDKVVAILGPLPSAEVEEAAKQSQNLGMPLLVLAQKRGIPALSDYLFRFSLTPTMQSEALVRYASRKKEAKRFGVFYPKSNYGQEFLTEFEKSVQDGGGKIIAREGFNPAQPDLLESVRQLKLGVEEMKAGGKLFDAIFIPDSYLTVGKVAPALSKAGLNGMVILGTNAWNDASLSKRIGTNLPNAYFVDLFFKDSARPTVKQFVQDFQSAYNYSPSTLEAMGYDSVKILSEALGRSKNPKKENVRGLLLDVRGFQGATGLRGFSGDREAEIDSFILHVDGQGIQEEQ